MAAPSSRPQKRVTGRVMHEFKHGELKSGLCGGKGGKVRSRRQAIAIALEEAGASKYESDRRNRRNLRRTKGKEAHGRTVKVQGAREGKSHVGAYRKRESAQGDGRWEKASQVKRLADTTGRGSRRSRKADGTLRQELYWPRQKSRRVARGARKMSKSAVGKRARNALNIHACKNGRRHSAGAAQID